jgi:hypothetical protein
VPGGRLSFISTIGYSTGDAPDEPDSLNQDQKLASLEASYRLPKSVQVGVYYRLTDTRTYEKVPDDFFPLDINVQVGTLGARTIIERFDYLFDPRSGWGMTSDIGWSGEAIGSDLEYVSWFSGFSLALEPIRDTTWMQAMKVGIAEPLKGTSLDREARFFAGGQSSVRGFDLNTVGPVTYGIDGSLVPAGGGALFILNEELRIPIWDPLRLVVDAHRSAVGRCCLADCQYRHQLAHAEVLFGYRKAVLTARPPDFGCQILDAGSAHPPSTLEQNFLRSSRIQHPASSI